MESVPPINRFLKWPLNEFAVYGMGILKTLFMGYSWDVYGIFDMFIYPLVNIQNTMERSTIFKNGKSAINGHVDGIFGYPYFRTPISWSTALAAQGPRAPAAE